MVKESRIAVLKDNENYQVKQYQHIVPAYFLNVGSWTN